MLADVNLINVELLPKCSIHSNQNVETFTSFTLKACKCERKVQSLKETGSQVFIKVRIEESQNLYK